jgi:regulator of sigma E protease
MIENITKLTLIFASLLSVFFIHELGHYIVGRLLNLKISEFSIGMGPVKFLPKFTDHRGTVWRLGLLPIGAYVRFARQEEPEEDSSSPVSSIVNLGLQLTMFIWKPIVSLLKRIYDPIDETKARGKYYIDNIKPRYKIPLALIGPVSNFIFSFALISILYANFGRNPVHLEVKSDHSSLLAGDKIQLINDQLCFSLQNTLLVNTSGKVKIIRGDQVLELENVEIDRKQIKIIDGDNSVMLKSYPVQLAFQDLSFIIQSSLLRILNIGKTIPHLGGIVSIVKDGFDNMSTNIPSAMAWTALISTMLGVLNILIIPPLDGGAALLAFIESISPRKYRKKIEDIFSEVAFIFVLFILGVTLRSDLKIASRFWGAEVASKFGGEG